MAYSIVKHRRGTTQEWKKFNIVPAEGELVIEECLDGIAKCKIGDGVTCYSELPYLADDVRQAVFAYIDHIKAIFEARFDLEAEATDTKLIAVKQELEVAIAEGVKTLISAYQSDDATLLASAKDYADKAATAAAQGASGLAADEIKKLHTTLLNSINALEQALLKTEATLTENSEKSYNELVELFDDKLDKASEETANKFAEVEQQMQTVAATAAQQLTDAEKALQSEITQAKESAAEALQSKSEELTNQHNADITAINDTLSTALQTIDNNFEDARKDTEAKLDSLKEDVSSECAAALATAKTEVAQAIKATEDLLKAELSTATTDIKGNKQKIAANEVAISGINTILANLATIDAVSSVIGELRESHSSDISTLTTSLGALSTTLEALEKYEVSFSNEVYSLTNKLRQDLNNLSDSVNDYYTENSAAHTDLQDDITALSAQTAKADADLSDRLTSTTADIYEKLSELINQDTALITAINGVYINLDVNFRNEISAINTVLQQQRTTLDSLNDSISFYHRASLAQISQLETRTLKREAELAGTVVEVSNRVDDLKHDLERANTAITVQANRISNLAALPYGSTAADAELMDIRTDYHGITHPNAAAAVHQIGHDLDALKESLPDFIPDSAIDGLHYEDNVLYLTSKGKHLDDSGEPLYSTVEITGGNGLGIGSTIVKMTEAGDTNIAVAKGNPLYLSFIYTSTEEGVPTEGNGTVNIYINNKRISDLTDTVVHGVRYSTSDITKYLKEGANTVKVTCNDALGGSRSVVYSVSLVDLRIESSFKPTTVFEDAITFRYTVHGLVQKTVHILVDNVEVSTTNLNAAVTGREATYYIKKQSHGSHKIKAYVTATIAGVEVPSNILEYEILCSEPNKDTAMLASVFKTEAVTQGDLVSIPYMVYDPRNADCTVNLSIYSVIGGVRTLESSINVTADRKQQLWNTRKYPAPTSVFVISYTYTLYGVERTESREHVLSVTPLDVQIEEVSAEDLQLMLSSAGRLNTDAAKATWTFTPVASEANPNPTTITTEFRDFNWSSNGWITDENDDTCLRINGDARAIIDFKIFKEDFKTNGKTIEFEFAVRDVHKRDTVVIECNKSYHPTTGACVVNNSYGFIATPDTAIFSSSGTQVSCNYKDDERIRVSITVESGDTASKFVSMYLDGVLSGIQHYEGDIFQQNNATPILLGSSDCCLDLYSIRVYNKALTHEEILNNYIMDKADPVVKQNLVTENDILDPITKKVSYDAVKKLGTIPIITFTGAMPTYKGDKKKASEGNGVHFLFEDPARSSEPLIDCVLKEIDVQGTSSQFYVRKNWKIKFDDKIEHMPGAIQSKTYCIKVDYAEATGTHNTGCANFVETLYDRNQVILPPQKDDSRIRTTIQGFPCVIFEKTSEEAEPVFASKGNFNYDKGAENAFGFTKDYDSFGVECWEFCNNTADPCNFVGPIKSDWSDDFEPRYVPESLQFDKIEKLLELKDAAAKDPPEGTMTENERKELATLQAACIKNFKEMHDWVLSTATYTLVGGARVAIQPKPLEHPVTYGGTEYTIDDKAYRLAKFKAEFKKYFNMHYCNIYYVFTLFALMTDQRAKNMFLTRWEKPVVQNSSTGTWWIGEEDTGIDKNSPKPVVLRSETGSTYYQFNGQTTPTHYWYPYFYDNDTIFGINNEGALVFDYYHEDIDQIETENFDEQGNLVKTASNVYNGQNSVLWNNFRECFPAEISNTYKSLRKSGSEKLSYDKLVDCFITKGSDKWSAMIYNEDAEYKYVSMARYEHAHTENGKEVYGIDASNLYQVRGTGEQHLRYFLANRLMYCDSKWYAGNYPNDLIFLRIYTPAPIPQDAIDAMTTEAEKQAAIASNNRINASLAAVPADPSITVTPFSDMYAGVKYKANGTLQQKRAKAGVAYKFSPPYALDEDLPETETPEDGETGSTGGGIVIPDGSESAGDETYGDTETAVYGASEISSLGNLAGLYCGVINVSNAGKLTELIIGSNAEGYHNDNFRELHVGTNRLLKKLDVRNCSGLGIYGKSPQKTLDLSGCPNIEEIYADGTNLASIALPTSGYIKVLHLPASTSKIEIQNQHHLTPEGFKIANDNYSNVSTLRIENCPGLDTNAMLEKCCIDIETGKYSVERVRLTDINWRLPDVSFLESLYPKYDEYGNIIGGIRGIDEKNGPTEDAYLKGTCHIYSTTTTDEHGNTSVSYLSGDDYAEVKRHYKDLTLTFDNMRSRLTFKVPTVAADGTVTYTDTSYWIDSTNSVLPSFRDTTDTPEPKPVWPENDAFTYTHIGWSRREQPYLGLADTTDLYVDEEKECSCGKTHNHLRDEYYQIDALSDIEGARVVYPVFKAVRKKYIVKFYNRTAPASEQYLCEVEVPYGHAASYPGATPTKRDSAMPEQYPHSGWNPEPSEVLGNMECDAKFTFVTAEWMDVPLADISDYKDFWGNTLWGYATNESSQTMTISNCKNKLNKAYRIPPVYMIPDEETGKPYTVTALGGFSNSHHMERVILPDTVTTMLSNAFYNCYKLTEITLPPALTIIGSSALRDCHKLTSIVIPATVYSIGDGAFADCPLLKDIDVSQNSYFTIDSGCLVDIQNKKLIQGALDNVGVMPSFDVVQTMGEYCFSNTPIQSIEIPEGITKVPSNAFAHCEQMTHVTLPDSITLLDATCFAWCYALTSITLPPQLTTISTFVLHSCPISTLNIPASVTSIGQEAFGKMTNLREVTFNKRVVNGEVVIPTINELAFLAAGHPDGVVFNLPWTEQQISGAPWGAKNATVNYAKPEVTPEEDDA